MELEHSLQFQTQMSGDKLDHIPSVHNQQHSVFICFTAMKEFAAIVHYHELINSPSQYGKGPLVAGSPSVAPGSENRDNRDEADDNVNCTAQKNTSSLSKYSSLNL